MIIMIYKDYLRRGVQFFLICTNYKRTITNASDGLEMVAAVVGNGGKRPNGRFAALPLAFVRNLYTTKDVAMTQGVG